MTFFLTLFSHDLLIRTPSSGLGPCLTQCDLMLTNSSFKDPRSKEDGIPRFRVGLNFRGNIIWPTTPAVSQALFSVLGSQPLGRCSHSGEWNQTTNEPECR